MSSANNDGRMRQLAESLERLAAGHQPEEKLALSDAHDRVDQVIAGVNLLAEELDSVRKQLDIARQSSAQEAPPHRIADELKEAVERGQLHLYYQPVVDLRSGAMKGVEALIRWHHPQRGLVMPDTFIPDAEESGGMVDLDLWVLHNAAGQLAHWQRHLNLDPAFSVRVNISAAQLHRKEFVDEVQGVLRCTGVQAESMALEITETAVAKSISAGRRQVSRLKKLGVGVSIDDFGTGFSSISYLRNFPADTVKIDRSLLEGAVDDPGHREFLSSLLALANACEKHVVFEGIETLQQAQMLQELGFRSGQGYYFGRPADAATMTQALRNSSHLTSAFHH